MTIAQQIQDVMLAMATTINVWRDFAVMGLAALVIVCSYAAASAR